MDAWSALIERIAEIETLSGIHALVEWDQQTYMPRGAAEGRGRQAALLARLRHERFTDPRVGGWLAELAEKDLDATRRAAVRVLTRQYRRATCLPATLVEALGHARNDGYNAWMAAREADSFAPFEGPLQRLLDLTREQAAAYGHAAHPYDALLEDYDPGSTVAELRPMFTRLGAELNALLDTLAGRPHPAGFGGALDVEGQRKLSERVLDDLGFDRTRGRLDLSEHPFSTGIGPGDTRITTHFHAENFLAALGGTIHEAGHGMYEQGLRTDRPGWGLDVAAGMGIHESQSRFWENVIGRSLPFCRYLAPRMRAIWPDRDITADGLYGAFNRVERSLVRIFADEVTYNLHVIARFELELGILEGRLQARDLPEAWDDAYRRHVGVVSPRPHDGVLQDVHWSGGMFGYFPSYTLGNLYAASLGATMQSDMPDMWRHVEAGNFAPILAWMRAKVHVRGSEVDAPEIVRDACGDRDPVSDLVESLWARHGALYGVSR
ncbi:MAG: hypothetical protein RLZZ299_2534 [Pseudomonadota bacterium]|jgi:carboxypeptidase Taq